MVAVEIAGCTIESGFTSTADGNNHLPAWSYDASGNAQSDGTYSYTYDAESQIKSAAGVTYLYDGSGRRVSKSSGKLYWYGSGGEILAETDASGNTLNEYIFFGGKRIAMLPAGGNAQYYVEDLLGTSRVMTNNTGTVCYDADFYPYGGERAYTNSCPTGNNYKFEGKERDTETGNDDFGARYYSNRFGRWLSADWSSTPVPVPYANLTNPQTLNLYAMVADDPESSADLDGHSDAGTSLNQCMHQDSCRTAMFQYEKDNPVGATLTPLLTAGGVTAGGVTAAFAPWEAGAIVLRNLLGLAAATAPVTAPIVVDTLEGLTPGAPGSLTISSSTRLSSAEISTGVRLAQQTGQALVQSEHVGAEFVRAAGKTYDAMGTAAGYASKGSNMSEFTASIANHLLKAVDYVAIDLKGASKDQVTAIKTFVGGLSKAEQKKITFVNP